MKKYMPRPESPLLLLAAALFAAIALSALLAGCDIPEPGPVMEEDAVIEDVLFQAAVHGSGSGIGFDGRGNISPTFVSVHVPEKRTVVLHCQHGRFAQSNDRHEWVSALWESAEKGQHVTLRYQELKNNQGQVVGYRTVGVQ